MLPRKQALPVGLGPMDIPYDQSGGQMSTGGMSVPEPQGPMKKMQFEFTDPAQAAAQQVQQIPPGAGIPPAGMQPPQQSAGPQQPPQGDLGSLFGQMAGGAGQMPQGPDSSMLSDDQLASMLQQDPMNPIDTEADALNEQLMGGQVDPELQMRMMEAARRAGGF